MAPYNGIPHLLIPVINKPKDAILALRWLVREMEERYQRLQSLGARNIESYNERVETANTVNAANTANAVEEHMPYLILVIDELADLMLLAAKEIEDSISRLAAMSRAVGIHLIFATQRPSVDVLTGVIKNNFPARIAFQVASTIDSRTILDAKGADKLLGKGDSLFMGPGSPAARRVQGAFLSEAEVEKTTAYLRSLGTPQYETDILDDEAGAEDESDDFIDEDDPLYEDAVSIVLTTQRASASYLQRRLKIGYNRSSRMVERMERDGIVGPQLGSKPREILRPN
jgi:S-DNA-T family DNA segregation ATPase FtsK/SpoIIIE